MALTAQEMVDKYIAAEAAILEGKTITFEGQTLSREDLDKVRTGRREWERRVAAESNGARHGLARFV